MEGQDDRVLTVLNLSLLSAAGCIHIFPAILALARNFQVSLPHLLCFRSMLSCIPPITSENGGWLPPLLPLRILLLHTVTRALLQICIADAVVGRRGGAGLLCHGGAKAKSWELGVTLGL